MDAHNTPRTRRIGWTRYNLWASLDHNLVILYSATARTANVLQKLVFCRPPPNHHDVRTR